MQVILRTSVFGMMCTLALCCLSTATVGASGEKQPALRPAAVAEIRIDAQGREPWRVTYRLDKPVTQIVFARSTDDNRARTWIASVPYEIVRIDGSEIVRRRDGRAFKVVALRVPPEYAFLPKDYAPFSPFGDGGILFHSGRFFACAQNCPDDPHWRMRLSVPGGHHILLNGQRKVRRVAWEDSGSGRGIYVGTSLPVETPDLIAVIDTSLPDAIRSPLTEELPELMRFFAARLGALESRPMLFASYDAAFPRGYGSQGGVLPGQIFMHYYGSGWPERMKRATFGEELTWHFAHEAAHLYHRRNFDSEDGWIHEGSAEAFAAIVLRGKSDSYVKSRVDRAGKDCSAKVERESIRDVLAEETFDVAYSCGLVLALAIDDAIKRVSPQSDGLFAVWRDLTAALSPEAHASEDDFLAALGRVSNASLADAVRKAVRTAAPELTAEALLSSAPN